MRITLLICLSLLTQLSFSQDQLDKINILSYDINLHVSDTNDIIHVTERVYVEFKEDCERFYLNLKRQDSLGIGMRISYEGVKENNVKVTSFQYGDELYIIPKKGKKGFHMVYEFEYSGIPANGLIIGKNKFNDRTFFGDNWPNRAQHWFACIDHPADKASVNFTVYAPKHYDCIATGVLETTVDINENERLFAYRSDIPLPTKVMVVGLADFAVEKIEHLNNFPLTAWVYEKDAENGFTDMAVAGKVVTYFIKNIGDYPYQKLANVQSTTMFGGMENAGNIFYDENAVTGEKKMEALIAHEIAHQWFGNSASEEDWQHVWLSEGFATYFTDLYFEYHYGDQAFKERLINERERVIKFSKQYDHPVVDTTYKELMHLLNPNSYQKGAWFLHMLRNEIGTTSFWLAIRRYYHDYKYSNASTADFMEIVEEESNMDLKPFFNQWLKTYGHPILKTHFNSKGKKNYFHIEQIQSHHIFNFPIEIELIFEDETTEVISFELSESTSDFEYKSEKKVMEVVWDPNVNLLFEHLR